MLRFDEREASLGSDQTVHQGVHVGLTTHLIHR
jgi:hypothetical protein